MVQRPSGAGLPLSRDAAVVVSAHLGAPAADDTQDGRLAALVSAVA
jgi:hypothetical protein